MEGQAVDAFVDVSTTINEINSTLNETSFQNISLTENKAVVSTFLKNLLSKQEKSHRKIEELQRSIQSKKYKPTSSDILSSTRGAFEDLNYIESPDVSLAPFMKDEESILNEESCCCSSSDIDELTTLGSYREIPSPSVTLNQFHIEEDHLTENTTNEFISDRSECDDECSKENFIGKHYQKYLPRRKDSRTPENVAEPNNLESFASAQNDPDSLLNDLKVYPETHAIDEVASRLERSPTSDTKDPESPGSPNPSTTCTSERQCGDELGLCIDIMAARIKELELEKERVKLDVIVALRKQFEKLTNTDDNNVIHSGTLEKLNDSVCEVAIKEVEKVRNQEQERRLKIEEEHQRKVEQLSDEVQNLRHEKSNLLCEVNEAKRGQNDLDEKQGKLERLQNRVSYLESLLRTVEKDNDKMKQNIQQLDGENAKLLIENKTLRNEVGDVAHQLDVSRTTDSKMKDFYEREREKMYDENKQVKDELTELSNQLMVVKQEKERLVNSKETDLSIIKHLEEKLKRQGGLLDTMSADCSRYFELNMKLENKAAQYKQKLKKSVYGIESTQEENKRLKNEKENLEGEMTILQKNMNESKRREHDLQFQFKKLRAELEQKQRELTLHKERFQGKSSAKYTNGMINDSYAVLDQWNESLGHVITSSVNDHVISDQQRVREKHVSFSKFRDPSLLPNLTLNVGDSMYEDSLLATKYNTNKTLEEPYKTFLNETEKPRTLRFESQSRALNTSKMNDSELKGGDKFRRSSLESYQEPSRLNVSNYIASPPKSYKLSDAQHFDEHSYRPVAADDYRPGTVKTNMTNSLQPMKLFSDGESGFEGSPVNRGPHLYPVKSWQSTTSPLKDHVNETGQLKHQIKYRGQDTKLFLQDMQYKLEHSEAAIKLADNTNISSSTSAFLDSAEKIHHKIIDLRNEVLEL